jgi:hypothetical protein
VTGVRARVGPGLGDPELLAEKIRAPVKPRSCSGRHVEPSRTGERRSAMPNLTRSTLVSATVILLLAACSTGGTSPTAGPPSASPSGAPTPAPSPSSGGVGAIDHATGTTDLLLRYEEGGGFMMPAFIATQAPIFTLYGDGTIIFRNPMADPPTPVGSVMPALPFRTAKLNEEQIQELLAFALGDGALGVARASYENVPIADAGTAVFTVDAGGVKKTVSVTALGLEVEGMPDVPARAAFKALADRLADFDNGGATPTDEYSPERYRGILTDGAAAPDQKPWPWADIKPADFPFPADPNAFQLAQRALTAADVGKLGFDQFQGGLQGMVLVGPSDGKIYSLSLRPLLPDEPDIKA